MNVKLRVNTENVKSMLHPAITEPANTLIGLFDRVSLTSVCVAVDFVSIGKFCLVDLQKANWVHLRIDAFLDCMKANQTLVLAKTVFEDTEFESRNRVETNVEVKQICVLLQALTQLPDQSLARCY